MPVADHIDNAVRSVTFNPVASVGPFALPFPLYEADSAAELKSDFLITLDAVVQTNFTVAGTFIDGVAIDGAVTFGSAITGALIIMSRRRPRSSADWTQGQAVTALELQSLVNSMLASLRDTYDFMARVEAGTVLPAGTFVPTAGGTMTGFLDLNADPTTALKAATKQYVDGKLPLTTKGDLTSWSTLPVRVAVGINGKRLVADSTATPGIAWKRNSGATQTLTDAANIAWDFDLGDNAVVTLAGNRTLSAPSNVVIGQYGYLDVIQDATGSRTLAWNAAYSFPGNSDEKPTPDANARTRYIYWALNTGSILIKKIWTFERNSIGWYKEYDKGANALSTVYTQAHGLGRNPAQVQAFLECTTTDAGWAVGDRLLMATGSIGSGPICGATVAMNTTNAYFVTSSAALLANNKATGASAALTTASWKVIMRVYE